MPLQTNLPAPSWHKLHDAGRRQPPGLAVRQAGNSFTNYVSPYMPERMRRRRIEPRQAALLADRSTVGNINHAGANDHSRHLFSPVKKADRVSFLGAPPIRGPHYKPATWSEKQCGNKPHTTSFSIYLTEPLTRDVFGAHTRRYCTHAGDAAALG
jgi:hypothetical protein